MTVAEPPAGQLEWPPIGEHAALLACRDVLDGILCGRLHAAWCLRAAAGNLEQAYATSAGSALEPPLILEDGELLHSGSTGGAFRPTSRGKLLASWGAVRPADANEERQARQCYTAEVRRFASAFTDASFRWLQIHFPASDARNLDSRLGKLHEQIVWLEAGDAQALREVTAEVHELLGEARSLAADPVVKAWYAGHDSEGDVPFWRDMERAGAEREAREAEVRRQRGARRAAEDAKEAEVSAWVEAEIAALRAEGKWDEEQAARSAEELDALVSRALAAGEARARTGRRLDDPRPVPKALCSAGVTFVDEDAAQAEEREDVAEGQAPFPTDALPGPIADYLRKVAKAHDVSESLVGLAMLVVAGAAIGNAWRLRLKGRFTVPPTIWAAIVAPSGSNKTAPLSQIVEPLRRPMHPAEITGSLLNPPGQALIGDATVEAVISRLSESPRGLLCCVDELAGWARSFGQYKSGGGGDKQTWLELWNAAPYQLDRKTNNESVFIPAAAVAVLGGIQPRVFAQAFSAEDFASGLVPRLLVAMPARRRIRWTEVAVSEGDQAVWEASVTWLRAQPFASVNDRGHYQPHVLFMSDEAMEEYVPFYNAADDMVPDTDAAHALSGKARTTAARIALILHGLARAVGPRYFDPRVGRLAARGGVSVATWCLAEQLRAFGLASRESERQRLEATVAWIRRKGGRTTTSKLNQSQKKRYPRAADARADLDRLVAAGKGRWEGKEFVLVA